MAKLKKGILGPISGKIGPIIGSSWKGVAYLKAIDKTTRVKTLSPAQRMHHQKFSFLTRLLRPFHPYLMVGFKLFAEHTTEINAAFAYNFKAALVDTDGELSIDYHHFRVSRGDLKGIHQPNLILLNENTLRLTWQNLAERLSEHNDQLMLAVYNE